MTKALRENYPYYKRMLTIAVPIMIQNGVTNFVSMLDNIMVGRVGTFEMTGVSIVNQLLFVFNLCVFGAMSGAGIFTAQFYGKKDINGVRSSLQFKTVSALIITLLGLLVFLCFGDSLISAYIQKDSSPEDIIAVTGFSKSYLKIMLIQTLPFSIAQVYSSTLRETNDRLVPMFSTLIAVAVNLILNYTLIFGHFGAPEMGIEGAAIATVTARFIECGILIFWAHSHKKKYPYIKSVFTKFTFTGRLIGKMTVVTLPLLLNEALWSAGMAFLNQCYSVRGLDVVAASNIVSTLSNVFNVSFIAFGSAIGIILSQYLGAGKKEEARKASLKLLWFSVFVVIVIGTAMALFAPLFPKIYNTTAEIKAIATSLLYIIAVFMPVHAFTNATYFTLRSGGKTFVTFLFDSGFVWTVAAPLAFCLSRFTKIPIEELYFLVLAADLIKCVLGYIFVKKGIWLNMIVDKEGTSK